MKQTQIQQPTHILKENDQNCPSSQIDFAHLQDNQVVQPHALLKSPHFKYNELQQEHQFSFNQEMKLQQQRQTKNSSSSIQNNSVNNSQMLQQQQLQQHQNLLRSSSTGTMAARDSNSTDQMDQHQLQQLQQFSQQQQLGTIIDLNLPKQQSMQQQVTTQQPAGQEVQQQLGQPPSGYSIFKQSPANNDATDDLNNVENQKPQAMTQQFRLSSSGLILIDHIPMEINTNLDHLIDQSANKRAVGAVKAPIGNSLKGIQKPQLNKKTTQNNNNSQEQTIANAKEQRAMEGFIKHVPPPSDHQNQTSQTQNSQKFSLNVNQNCTNLTIPKSGNQNSTQFSTMDNFNSTNGSINIAKLKNNNDLGKPYIYATPVEQENVYESSQPIAQTTTENLNQTDLQSNSNNGLNLQNGLDVKNQVEGTNFPGVWNDLMMMQTYHQKLSGPGTNNNITTQAQLLPRQVNATTSSKKKKSVSASKCKRKKSETKLKQAKQKTQPDVNMPISKDLLVVGDPQIQQTLTVHPRYVDESKSTHQQSKQTTQSKQSRQNLLEESQGAIQNGNTGDSSSTLMGNQVVNEVVQNTNYNQPNVSETSNIFQASTIQQSAMTGQTSQNEQKQTLYDVKQKLLRLFLNFCDFNQQKATEYITQSAFVKIVKETGITNISENQLAILMSTTLQQKTNLIKAISYEQFLNLISAVAELKAPQKFKQDPKNCLLRIIDKYFVPLLNQIESSSGQAKFGVNALYSHVDMAQHQLVFNDDTVAIFQDISPLIRQLYLHYFDQETSAMKMHMRISPNELRRASLSACLQFARDFQLCPYMLHQKVCFFVWHNVQETINSPNLILNLTNNYDQSLIVPQQMQLGKCFTLAHFVIFIYRCCILSFDAKPHQDHIKDFNLVKKLLYSLRILEKAEGLDKFQKHIGRTYTKSLSFLPGKNLLAQIIVCEKLDRFISGRTIESFNQEDLVARIIDAENYIELEATQQTKKLMTVSQHQEIQEENQIGYVLEPHEEQLRQIFQIYASFGEPTNTQSLKSSKIQKLMRDAGLILNYGPLPLQGKRTYASQLTTTEVDLIFTQCSSSGHSKARNAQRSASPLVKSQGFNKLDPNSSSYIWKEKSQDLSKFKNQHRQSMGRSTLQKSDNSLIRLPSQRSFLQTNTSQLNINNTQERSLSPCQPHLNQTQSRSKFDFGSFIQFLIKVGQKVYPNISNDKPQAVLLTVQLFILPLLNRNQSRSRQIQNSRLTKLIQVVNTKTMIEFMSDLFVVISGDLYAQYTKGNSYRMTYDMFNDFARDHDIFPAVCSQAALYRIFHSLSHHAEQTNPSTPQKQQLMHRNYSQNDVSVMSPRALHISEQMNPQQTIDENLFVEAVTLCALYPDKCEAFEHGLKHYKPQRDMQYTNENPTIGDLPADFKEVCLMRCLDLVQRINKSGGRSGAVRTLSKTGKVPVVRIEGSEIKGDFNDKAHVDLLQFFKTKKLYSWYFQRQQVKRKRFSPKRTRADFDQLMMDH